MHWSELAASAMRATPTRLGNFRKENVLWQVAGSSVQKFATPERSAACSSLVLEIERKVNAIWDGA